MCPFLKEKKNIISNELKKICNINSLIIKYKTK